MLVHPSVADKISESSIIENKAYPLLRELVYQYGVQVVGYQRNSPTDDTQYARLLLAWKEIPVGGIYFDRNTSQFAFRTVMAPKERGRTYEDKYTYFATKVSVLMRSIKKYKLMPEHAEELLSTQFRSTFWEVPTAVARSFTSKYKSSSLDSEEIHTLLNIAFNNQDQYSLSKESMDKYKSLLDIFNRVDKVRAEQAEELKSIFSNPVWTVGYDNSNTFIVGKLDFTFSLNYNHDIDHVTVELVEPFVRVKDVDHIDELIPRLTMLKVHMQQNHQDKIRDFGFLGESQLVPKRLDMYIPELRVYGTKADTWGSLSDMRWTFVL
jgi:hypothetical protein